MMCSRANRTAWGLNHGAERMVLDRHQDHAFSAGATGSQVVREIDSERTLMPQ